MRTFVHADALNDAPLVGALLVLIEVTPHPQVEYRLRVLKQIGHVVDLARGGVIVDQFNRVVENAVIRAAPR